MKNAIERLIEAIGYPERTPDGALSFTLQVDGADVLAEERGGRLRLSLALSNDKSLFPKFAAYAAGRMLREEATLTVGELAARTDPSSAQSSNGPTLFLWQDVSAAANDHALARLFETFMDSCDWWRARVEEQTGNEERATPELFMIRP